MKTLYIRNVPDDVAERLAKMAAREGMSLSALAVRELSETARRANNAALLEALPDLGISSESIVSALHEARAER